MKMQDRIEEIREFFSQYEANFNDALRGDQEGEDKVVDPGQLAKRTAKFFSDCFIGANPRGVACAKNDDEFISQIQRGYDFYRSLGTLSMKISGLKIVLLDDYHAQAIVAWRSTYSKKDEEGNGVVIDFEVIYLLQTIANGPKIFAYITGDEQSALRQRGLL